jgi:hypothetical protein
MLADFERLMDSDEFRPGIPCSVFEVLEEGLGFAAFTVLPLHTPILSFGIPTATSFYQNPLPILTRCLTKAEPSR